VATPRRYYQPDFHREVAGRIYGGMARQDPDALLHGWVGPFVERPSVRGQRRILAGRIPRAWLHVVPAAGHLFLLERPAAMAALVADFLAPDNKEKTCAR
jgi:hypothetical protein